MRYFIEPITRKYINDMDFSQMRKKTKEQLLDTVLDAIEITSKKEKLQTQYLGQATR